MVNNNLCTATRLSDAQGPLSSPTWKSPVFLLNELAIIARSTFIFAISSWIDIYALCILSNAKNTEYKNRIFNSGGGLLVCDSIESCLSIHRSAASFLSQYTGIIQEHAPKTKCQKHKTSSVVVIDGNQEIEKSALPPSLKLPGGDLTKPRAGTAGLPLNISFLLKPNFRHSCIPLFKRKNVQAAVMPSNPPANSNSDPC